jgi:hypothetical protein
MALTDLHKGKDMGKIIVPGEPGFYINRKRYIETEGRVTLGVEGRYTLRAIKPGRGVVREASFPNLITDMGMNSLGNDVAWNRMHLGTGTTTPAVTDTGLAAFGTNVVNANPTVTTGNSGVAPYYGYARMVFTSAVGGATGNWTEIGISKQNTDGLLRSRALILDGGGSPTTFPVQSDEQFEGTYEFRIYVPTVDTPASITLSGTPYDTITRALRASDAVWAPSMVSPGNPTDGLFRLATGSQINTACTWYSGALAATTAANPAGTQNSTGSTSMIAAAYGAGNFYRDYGLRSGAAVNVGTLRTARLIGTNTLALQVEYTPTITKLTTEELIHNQRISWARA